ncbi:MAG: tetratricopeptide repeat protein [bacterium]
MIKKTTSQQSKIYLTQESRSEWTFEFPRLDERAYALFHEALEYFDIGNYGKAEKELQLLLEGFPEFIDVAHHLAIIFDETGRHKEAKRLWEVAVEMGLSALPRAFKRGRHKLPWVILENRPFLRVYHSWGLLLLKEKKVTEAVTVFKEILSMNPNDNQSIRSLVIDSYFQLGQPDQVLATCRRFRNDTIEEVLYGRPLALFQLQREQEARTALLQAIDILPLIAEELVKKSHRPPKNFNPHFITIGGNDQAYYYWRRNGQYWEKTNGALQFVASVLTLR